MVGICAWLMATSWATGIRESLHLYPILYTVHIFGFIILVTATSALNLRMLGWGLPNKSVDNMAEMTLPCAKAGFALNITTGFLVFAAQAVPMYLNTAFRLKMLMVLLAGVNVLVFNAMTHRKAGRWGESGTTPQVQS